MSRTYEQLEPVISALDERIKTGLSAFPTDTAEGSIASFPDGADDIPLKSLVVNIDPVQDTSSGDPSPENICPISGWTGMTVNRTVKNLLSDNYSDYSTADTYAYLNGVVPKGQTARFTFTDKDTSVDISGCFIGFIYNDPSSGPPVNYRWVINDGVMNSNKSNTSTQDFSILCSNVFIYPKEAFNKLFARYNIMVELGSEATDYEPYNGQTVSIDWQTEAGTVYGGHLDVLSGVLTVYPYYASYNGETLTGRWISDRDVYAVGTTPTIGAQVVNIGAEGTEIQLSPHDVKTLLGQNNIFADTGDSSVEYRADTKLYIERLTEPDADMIADANITSGSYFMVGNILYKATANIASGSAVIEGTNATRKSLSEALNEINQ